MQFFDKLDKIIWRMDEPFACGYVYLYAQRCVFEEAKKHGLTVVLDRQGSGEQLAGYTPFYKVLFIELMKKRNVELSEYLCRALGRCFQCRD